MTQVQHSRARRAKPITSRDRSDEGRGRTALVTGASAGIGRALSELLAAKGYDVMLVARRMDRLEAIAGDLESRFGVTATPLAFDLSLPDSPKEIVDLVHNRVGHLDFLVNNAGLVFPGRYEDTVWEDQEKFVRVMALSGIELAHRFLPPMLEQGWGRILNVSSISALFPATPETVLYSASKAMVLHFSEGLALECSGRGVHVTASMPGFTATDLYDAAGWGHSLNERFIVKLITMSPYTVARQAYGAVMTGRPSLVHGVHHKVFGATWKHLPAPITRRMALFTAGLQE